MRSWATWAYLSPEAQQMANSPMKDTDKIVQLVVNKDKPAHPVNIGISMGAEIKYSDAEVTLVKMKYNIGGQIDGHQHFIVNTPKE